MSGRIIPKFNVVVLFVDGGVSELKNVEYFDLEWAVQFIGNGEFYIIPKTAIKSIGFTLGTGETECVL